MVINGYHWQQPDLESSQILIEDCGGLRGRSGKTDLRSAAPRMEMGLTIQSSDKPPPLKISLARWMDEARDLPDKTTCSPNYKRIKNP
jgi:hypothetical protein